VKWPPFSSCGCGGGGVFFQVVFGVENALSTVHFPLGHWTIEFPCKLLFLFVCLGGGDVKAKSYQVPDMFPKEFSIAPHFYPICLANVVLLSNIYLGQSKGTWHFKIEPSILRSLCSYFFSAWCANQMLLIWGIICGGLDKKSLQLECTQYTYICSLSPANSWMELVAQVMQSGHTLHRYMYTMCRPSFLEPLSLSLSLSLRMIMKAELI
jgi:hypothetical protein